MKISSGDSKIPYSVKSKDFILSEEVMGSCYSRIADASKDGPPCSDCDKSRGAIKA